MLVKDCMTRKVEWIAPDVTLREAARRMKDNEVGCLPVGENDRLIGMITDHDIVCRAVADGKDPSKTRAREVMSNGITWCYEDQSLEDAIELMSGKQIHHLPVLNRSKRMIGMLSLSDLALRGGTELPGGFFKLLSRDATRHAAAAARPH
jgi:CBS domain-containing protein